MWRPTHTHPDSPAYPRTNASHTSQLNCYHPLFKPTFLTRLSVSRAPRAAPPCAVSLTSHGPGVSLESRVMKM